MTRITMKHLELLIEQINKLAGTPLTYCDKSTNRPFKINIGHYHLDCAYSGYKLVQTDNDSGGIRDISRTGYTTKRELYNQLKMFIQGLETAKELKQ